VLRLTTQLIEVKTKVIAKGAVGTGADPGSEDGGGDRGSGGRKSPSGVQGQSPWWGSGGEAPEADAFLRFLASFLLEI
jgi:hypothetical protein